METPKEIEKYLVKDEFVEHKFCFGRLLQKSIFIYATYKRLFIKEGNTIRDISYEHISSIMLREKRDISKIVLGAFIILASLFMTWYIINNNIEYIPIWPMPALGIISLVLFLYGLKKRQYVEITVVGMTNVVKLRGSKGDLELLYKYIRENRIYIRE